ncbi:MAG: hypothetical protein KJP19_06790 [Deltaproteobacteria bacterium]|nr:hypothetical protein [Deltaproteobacteria bacterium]
MKHTGYFFSPIVPLLFLTSLPVDLLADTARDPKTAAGSPPVSAAADVIDIYGPIVLPNPPPYYVYALLLLALIAAFICYYFWKKRQQEKPLVLPDPAELALASLQRAELQLPETGPLVFAAEASQILRSYIEQTFNIGMTRQTTTEFFSELNQKIITDQGPLSSHVESLKQCLSLCDLVKFARFLPEGGAVKALGNNVRTFIKETRKTTEGAA